MIEEKKECELIIAVLEEVVEKADLWHHYKASLSADASEKIELVVRRR